MILNNKLTLLQNYLLQNYIISSKVYNSKFRLSHLNINLLFFKNRNKKNYKKIKTQMFLKLLIIFKLCFNNLGIVLNKKKTFWGICLQFNSTLSSANISLVLDCLIPTLYKLRLKYNVRQKSFFYINIFLSSLILKFGYLQKKYKYFYINNFFCKIFIGINNISKNIFNFLIINYLRY